MSLFTAELLPIKHSEKYTAFDIERDPLIFISGSLSALWNIDECRETKITPSVGSKRAKKLPTERTEPNPRSHFLWNPHQSRGGETDEGKRDAKEKQAKKKTYMQKMHIEDIWHKGDADF